MDKTLSALNIIKDDQESLMTLYETAVTWKKHPEIIHSELYRLIKHKSTHCFPVQGTWNEFKTWFFGEFLQRIKNEELDALELLKRCYAEEKLIRSGTTLYNALIQRILYKQNDTRLLDIITFLANKWRPLPRYVPLPPSYSHVLDHPPQYGSGRGKRSKRKTRKRTNRRSRY